MAIIKRPGVYDNVTKQWVRGPIEVLTHVGRVVSTRIWHDYRAMSDIYTNATMATIVKDDGTQEEILVNAGFELDVDNGRAIPDLDDEGRALIEAYNQKMAPVWEAARLAKEAHQAAEKAKQDAKDAYRAANKAVIGKKMIVVRGKKLLQGHIGVVAFISNNTGGVLLKPEGAWQDRKTDGIWVNPEMLEVYDVEKHATFGQKPVKKSRSAKVAA